MMTWKDVEQLDKNYRETRNAMVRKITRTWRYCKYQGCNACIRTNGLVPKTHEFAGKYGPSSFRR